MGFPEFTIQGLQFQGLWFGRLGLGVRIWICGEVGRYRQGHSDVQIVQARVAFLLNW